MSLESYAERTKPWISTANVICRHTVGASAIATEEANELIHRRIDDARLESEINRIRASTRTFWAKQGGAL